MPIHKEGYPFIAGASAPARDARHFNKWALRARAGATSKGSAL